MKDALFREVVRFDLYHILSRLRSSHAKPSWKPERKQTLCILLHNALQNTSVKPSQEMFIEQLRIAQPLAQELKNIANSFDCLPTKDALSDDGQEIIMDIIKRIAWFRQEASLQMIFTESKVDQSTVEKLIDETSKICRYYELSQELIDAARDPKYTILSNIRVEKLPQPVVDTGFLLPGPTFDETLARVAPASYESISYDATQLEFDRCMRNCRTKGKVHAEVQLLFFYERNQHIQLPRVLCSSKKACYLCHLFITSHGRFTVPKTHGKLYAGWLLPNISTHSDNSKLKVAAEAFKTALEIRTRQVIEGAPRHPAPNESAIGFDETWSPRSTVLSIETDGEGSLHNAQQSSTHGVRRGNPVVALPGPSAPSKSHPLSQSLVNSATSSRETLRPNAVQDPPSDIDEGPPTPTGPMEPVEQTQDSQRDAPRAIASPSLTARPRNPEGEAPNALAREPLELVDRSVVAPVALDPLLTEAFRPRTESTFATINLARGANHRIDLAPPSFSAHAHSRIMNLSLSWDCLPAMSNSAALSSPATTQRRLATVRWLDPQERRQLPDASDIDLASIEPGQEQRHAVGQDGLLLRWKGSVVSVKFELEADP